MLVLVAMFAARPTPAGIGQAAPVISRHVIDIDAPLSNVWAIQTSRDPGVYAAGGVIKHVDLLASHPAAARRRVNSTR